MATELLTEQFREADVDALIADQKHLLTLRIFPSGGKRDAGEVLNRFLKLDGGSPAEAAADEAAPWADTAVRDALKCPKADAFPGCVGKVPEVDTSILSALMPYDTWNPASSGAWQRYLAAPRTENALTVAIPNYLGLQSLAKLRLLQGLANGDVLPALQEVRQLARLTWSTEILVGEMVAVAMLSFERATYEEAIQRRMIPAESWTPVSKADTQALKRMTFGMAALYTGQAPDGALERVYAAVPTPLAECSAASEAMVTGRFARAIFGSPWPGEVHIPLGTAAIDALQSRGDCRLSFVGELWKDRSRDLDVLDNTTGLARLAFSVPYLRQLMGINLLEIATPSWNLYKASPTEG